MSILQESATAAAAGGKAQDPPQIDLATCAPDELSAWLLAHRFEGNAMDVASFLLNCTSTLPNAEEISAQLMGGGGDDEEDDDDAGMEDGENETDASGGEAEPAATAADVDPQTALLNSIQSSQPQPAFAHQNGNEVEVSCTNPRGKFLLSLHEGGVVLTNPKKRDEEQIPIGPDNVSHVVWFRKPEEYKKLKQLTKNGTAGKKPLPGHMVLICLKEEGEDAGIKFRNKPLGQVCFQLPSYPPPTEENDDEDNKQLTEGAWWEGLSAALFSDEKGGIVRAHAAMDAAEHTKGKGGFVFRSEGESGSATTTEGMPYVGCYQGFNDGALYPLREGLLFFKPPLFVPRSTLASISCGRGSGGSRYVDMVVQLDVPESDEQDGAKKKKQSDTLEFTNIHRDELNGLNDYIHKTLIPAMQADADGDSSSSDDDEEVVAEMVNSDEDESGIADEEKSNEEEEAGRKRRSSRAASKSAREITRAALNAGADGDDESDDDSDAFEEEDATDSDGSDEDESDASSNDEEFDEEADDSDDDSDCEGRMKKKARVD